MLFNFIGKAADSSNPLSIARVVGRDSLENLAREIAKLHKPIVFNWHAKFGLAQQHLQAASVLDPVRPAVVQAMVAATAQLAKADPVATDLEPADEPKTKQKLICKFCGEVVPYNVAKFCWFNKPKFGGNLYCIECQKKV